MKTAITIIFCRHGESHENAKKHLAKTVSNSKLTKKSVEQTKKFIPFFIKIGVQKVHYSPKDRARHISKYLNKVKIPHRELSNLTERNWGSWGKESWKDVSKRLDKLSIQERYKIHPPKGESWIQFEKRLFKR